MHAAGRGTVYAIIFRESNFSRIGTSRHFREWLNSRLRRRAMDEEISIIHSFSEGKISDPALRMHCVLYYYYYCAVHKSHSCVGIGGKSGGKYFCVLLNPRIAPGSTRLAKFAKIKSPRNIWRIQCGILTNKAF